jgi:tetratricopeptide (TPR) repeat protein
LLPNPAIADGNESWVGERIMTKKAGLRIGHTNPVGWQVYVGELTDMVYTVLDEKDGWLYVRQGGVEGWFAKDQAVLLGEAVSYFADRIRIDNKDALAFAHRGRARKEQGEFEKALRDLNEAIRLNPNNAAWFRARGSVYDELQEYDRAMRDYSEAIRLAPGDALAFNDRGIARKAGKEYDLAIRDYSDAIRLDPRWADAYFNRGNAYKAKKEYDPAIRDYGDAIRLDPQWTDAYFNRANAHKARKAYRQAASDFGDVIRIDPKDADALSSLAWLLATCPEASVRDGRKSVEYASKACELTSWKAPYFLAVLGAAWAELGDFQEAIKWQRKALEFAQYERQAGDEARLRLKLFEDRRPCRDE